MLRAGIAVVMSAFAASAFATGTLALGIPAALFATVLVIGAVTGWCPTALVRTAEPVRENTLGYPEARQQIDIDASR